MLGYCTNVHRGNTFKDVLSNISTICEPICFNSCQPVGVGLWFSNKASFDVDIPLLRDTLDASNVKAFTMNGFPYTDFHREIVKHKVYKPNWCEPERLDYTLRLANIMAEIIDSNEGGVSTLPLGWDTDSFKTEHAASMIQLCVNKLEDLEQRTGVCIHLDIEAEPGCRLQRSEDISNFVNTFFGDSETVRRYLRVCHDVCHSAVMHETTKEAVDNYKEAGLTIGKVQLSSAIEIDFDKQNDSKFLETLRSIAEPKYLHQTTIKKNNQIEFHENLSDLSFDKLSGLCRVHFHVPIHRSSIGVLQTTQTYLKESIPILADAGATDWEVETYTWDVMPTNLQNDNLVESISKELAWAANQIFT